jgi:hypothetical protein
MTFQNSRAPLLVGAAMIASAAYAVSPANAQQETNCVAGLGNNSEDTFGASSTAKSRLPLPIRPPRTTTRMSQRRKKQQAVLSVSLTRAAEQGIMKACQAVSPNKPIDARP